MYLCSHCDAQFAKWTGRCTQCGKWGTVHEDENAATTTTERGGKRSVSVSGAAARVLPLAEAAETAAGRRASNLPELDRVLGGGLVAGGVVLLSGEPGIGKSTLVAMLASRFCGKDEQVLYASGEESGPQVRLRFERLGLPSACVSYTDDLDADALALAIERSKPALAIVDSIQTLVAADVDSIAGSPNTVRAAAAKLLEAAKRTHIPLLIIGQVTKDGSIAGPKTLEHLVDVVLSLEGDPSTAYRLLRATKNRFGNTDEVGVFEMTSRGLEPVENPSAKFLSERTQAAGSVITCLMEGSRPFLVEIQALVEKTSFGYPVRRADGFDTNRMQMLIAILSRRAGIRLGESDVYVNVVGGLEAREPAVDLAVCAAIASAAANVPLAGDAIYVGEVGLSGEVRSVPMLDRRLAEAERLGLRRAIVPARAKTKTTLATQPISSVSELMK